MKFKGQNISSKPSLTMNFKTDNDYYSDKTIFETDDSDIQLEYNIFHKNNASFVIIQLNLLEWPITLMIDTGAAISIIAEDKINERIKIKNKTINLFGIAGRDKSIKTRGEVTAIFEVGDSKLSSSMHIVDTRYSGLFWLPRIRLPQNLQGDYRFKTNEINIENT